MLQILPHSSLYPYIVYINPTIHRLATHRKYMLLRESSPYYNMRDNSLPENNIATILKIITELVKLTRTALKLRQIGWFPPQSHWSQYPE